MAQTPTDTPCLLIISGPVGVGKSTVARELSNLLTRRGIAHSVVDLDTLAWTYPRPHDDPYGTMLALRNLHDVWRNCTAAGSRLLIVSRVAETERDVRQISNVVPDAELQVCQLQASEATLIERVRKREVGSGRSWHEERARELVHSLAQSGPADFTVDTEGRFVETIAEEIAQHLPWSGST